METPHLKTSYLREEKAPPNLFTDHDWLRHNQRELLDEFGECWIVIYQEKVLGTGATYHEALENAERNLPEGSDVITPICEWTGFPHPFLRAFPTPKAEPEKP